MIDEPMVPTHAGDRDSEPMAAVLDSALAKFGLSSAIGVISDTVTEALAHAGFGDREAWVESVRHHLIWINVTPARFTDLLADVDILTDAVRNVTTEMYEIKVVRRPQPRRSAHSTDTNG